MKTEHPTVSIERINLRHSCNALAMGIFLLMLVLLPEPALTQVTNNSPLTTYLSGPPGNFGVALAALGNDRVIIGASAYSTGASGAGIARLYDTNGTVLATITNPAPAASDAFGISVAAVGSDRILVGAYLDDAGAANAGSAYLFNTNGTLLTTITNPSPASGEQFGSAVAAVGNNRVLISAHLDTTGATGAGSVYLFSTNGTLLTTITNPTPAVNDGFGISIAVLGSDRLLVGAYQDDTGAFNTGAAYLFRTNGTLLATITNPIPLDLDQFGRNVASLGNDRLLISSGSGTRIMTTNGTLLTTIASGKLAAVGSDRVLVGTAGDNTFCSNCGAAFLYHTNGTLLVTFSPEFPSQQGFGSAVAAVGNYALIGGPTFDFAYLFDTAYTLNTNTQPALTITRDDTTVSISWVTAETGLILQQSDSVDDIAVWDDAPESVTLNGLTNTVQQTLENTNRFYRLRQP